MLKVRLQRVGRKNDPSFRLIVADSRKDSQSGKFIEVLGSYDARKGKPQIKADRVLHWISMGAQVSGTVNNLLIDAGVVKGKKVNVLPKKKFTPAEASEPIVKETPVAEAAPVAEEVPAEAPAEEAVAQ